MDLPDELLIIHQPVRLKVMTLLYKHGDIGFTEAQQTLELTPGNLDAHVKKLATAGLVDSRRALVRDHFEVRLRPTNQGVKAFEDYLSLLQEFLGGVQR